MSKPIDQIVAKHLEYFGYEIHVQPDGWTYAVHPVRHNIHLRAFELGVRLHCLISDRQRSLQPRGLARVREPRRTNRRPSPGSRSGAMRKAPGSSACGRCFPVRTTAACSGCSSMRGTRTSPSFAPRRARRRQGTKRRRRSTKSGRLRTETVRELPIPERRSGERTARDLPCQATSIQSVLFTEGPVEAGREVADVEQPTSPSVAPSQDTLRGLPGAESQVQVPGEVRADRDHTLCFQCYRADINPTRSRRLRERASPPGLRSSSSPRDLACSRVLDARRIAHRQRMLDHLQRASSSRRDGSLLPRSSLRLVLRSGWRRSVQRALGPARNCNP